MANLFDTVNFPQREPMVLVVGDRWTWKRTDIGTSYDPDSYALKYALRLFNDTSADGEIEITASESGTDYIVTVAAATTAAYAPGWYSWQMYIIRSSDSERITLERGRVEVKSNQDGDSGDPRNHNRIMLDALSALLQQKATRDQLSYSIADRSLSRMSVEEAQGWYDTYRRRVAEDEQAERAERGLGGGNLIRTRMD